MRAVLYTAVFGGYDSLGLTVPQNGDVDLVCFTDDAGDPDLGAGAPWTVVEEPGRYEHPRMSAKWYKLMAHQLFPECDLSVYVDGSMHKPNPDLVSWATAALGEGPIAAFRHPYFTDVYGDAADSLQREKYRGLPIAAQVEAYRAEGFPEHAGHFATGTLARRHNDLVEFGAAWLRECEAWTYQDQLSFPVVARRLGVPVAQFPASQLDNPFISPGGHRRQD